MNVEKVVKNVTHAAIIATMSYFATHPNSDYIWLAAGITWLAQCMNPPDLTVGPPTPLPVLKPKGEAPHVQSPV